MSRFLPGPLTPRQVEVLECFERGETMIQTSSRLWLSWETIRWHRKQACKRLGVRGMKAAVARARELGIL